MDNTIQQEGIFKKIIRVFKKIINTLAVLFGTIILLTFAIAAPLFLMKPTYNLLVIKEWGEAINTASNIFVGVTFALFAVMAYIGWLLFAKRSFIAWLGATLLMALIAVCMFFLI